jgi:hypothetical protein
MEFKKYNKSADVDCICHVGKIGKEKVYGKKYGTRVSDCGSLGTIAGETVRK